MRKPRELEAKPTPIEGEAGSLRAAMHALATSARAAARELSRTGTAQKDEALRAVAGALGTHARRILAANRADVAAARKAGQSAAFVDRLALDAGRVAGIARAVRDVAAL